MSKEGRVVQSEVRKITKNGVTETIKTEVIETYSSNGVPIRTTRTTTTTSGQKTSGGRRSSSSSSSDSSPEIQKKRGISDFMGKLSIRSDKKEKKQPVPHPNGHSKSGRIRHGSSSSSDSHPDASAEIQKKRGISDFISKLSIKSDKKEQKQPVAHPNGHPKSGRIRHGSSSSSDSHPDASAEIQKKRGISDFMGKLAVKPDKKEPKQPISHPNVPPKSGHIRHGSSSSSDSHQGASVEIQKKSGISDFMGKPAVKPDKKEPKQPISHPNCPPKSGHIRHGSSSSSDSHPDVSVEIQKKSGISDFMGKLAVKPDKKEPKQPISHPNCTPKSGHIHHGSSSSSDSHQGASVEIQKKSGISDFMGKPAVKPDKKEPKQPISHPNGPPKSGHIRHSSSSSSDSHPDASVEIQKKSGISDFMVKLAVKPDKKEPKQPISHPNGPPKSGHIHHGSSSSSDSHQGASVEIQKKSGISDFMGKPAVKPDKKEPKQPISHPNCPPKSGHIRHGSSSSSDSHQEASAEIQKKSGISDFMVKLAVKPDKKEPKQPISHPNCPPKSGHIRHSSSSSSDSHPDTSVEIQKKSGISDFMGKLAVKPDQKEPKQPISHPNGPPKSGQIRHGSSSSSDSHPGASAEIQKKSGIFDFMGKLAAKPDKKEQKQPVAHPNGHPKDGRIRHSSSSSSDSDSDDEDFAKVCLKQHNHYRNKHGVASLKLSKPMCKYAQEWADKCASNDSMRHRDSHKYGENIHMEWSSNPNFKVDGKKPVDNWYAEIKNHRFGTEPKSMGTGHFTQVVWKGSKELGVGIAKSKSGKIYVVANYDPPGNMIGSFSPNVPPTK